jgi:hypothetical protein
MAVLVLAFDCIASCISSNTKLLPAMLSCRMLHGSMILRLFHWLFTNCSNQPTLWYIMPVVVAGAFLPSFHWLFALTSLGKYFDSYGVVLKAL